MLFGLFLLAGCAAPGMNVTVGYTPFINATGGNGELYLVQDAVPQISQKALWIIGEVKGLTGRRRMISSSPPCLPISLPACWPTN